MDSDPAAHSLEEIKLAYPGYRAIEIYRISHVLYELGYKVHANFSQNLDIVLQALISIQPLISIIHSLLTMEQA